jgi:CRISPR-associated endonuclease/helicase Cas3
MRILANSLYQSVSDNKHIESENIKITLQTGEFPDDPYFLKGDIIFATIDQVLSSFLSIPLSLPWRQANINAGALIGSYLVFDEFHLLDSLRSLNTLFHMLKILREFSPFCLMTATLSDGLLSEFAKEVDAEIVKVDSNALQEIPSQKDKIRKLYVVENQISAQEIVKMHKPNTRSIVICNRVQRCQEVFLELQKLVPNKTKLICIHSRFFARHRKEKEKEIRKIFAKGAQHDAILVATQVIEVGLDITCELMHTEVAPINSLLQRFGRCARFAGESGELYIYPVVTPVTDDEQEENEIKIIRNAYAPYNRQLSEKTLAELKKINGQNLDYESGLKLINDVLENIELEELSGMKSSQRDDEIRKVWSTPEKAEASRLIRQIDAISIILHDEPYTVEKAHSIPK